jgi:hypothetical protein
MAGFGMSLNCRNVPITRKTFFPDQDKPDKFHDLLLSKLYTFTLLGALSGNVPQIKNVTLSLAEAR